MSSVCSRELSKRMYEGESVNVFELIVDTNIEYVITDGGVPVIMKPKGNGPRTVSSFRNTGETARTITEFQQPEKSL